MSKYHFTLALTDFDAWVRESLSERAFNTLKASLTGVMMVLSALWTLGVIGT